jgi:RadC-like JAB domain-containing protein
MGRHYCHRADLLTKIGDLDFGLDSSQPSLGRSHAKSEDLELTRRRAAGAVMGIDVVDQVILGDVRNWSFREAGRL